MSCILLNAFPKFAPNGSLRSLCGIGRAHEIAPGLNSVGLLESKHYAWATGHEGDEVIEEGAFTVDRIEALSERPSQLDELQGSNIESLVKNSLNDVSCLSRSDRIRLDYRECPGRSLVRHM